MSSAPSSGPGALTGGAMRPPSFSLRARVLGTPWTYRLLVLVVVGAAWEFYASTARLLLVPTFSGTILGIGQLVTDPKVWAAFAISNQALVVGFAVAVALGVVLGLAAARYRRIEGFVDPYLSILLVTPMAALIPILIMSFGVQSL